MNPNLKPEERELYKLVNYFKKRAEILIIENRLGEEYQQMLETCDKLIAQVELHAENRAIILSQRELLSGMVKDNAKCPTCASATHLKNIGTDTNEKGWKSNKYKCRRCNITFVWNAPNNPWDMIPYVEFFIGQIEAKLDDPAMDEATRESNLEGIAQMKANLQTLKPVVETSDAELKEFQERDAQMEELVHKFKKHLQIEKIRMEN